MCSIAKLIGLIITVTIILITSVIFREQIRPAVDHIRTKLIEAMGSDESKPQATVETHHNAI